MTQTLVIIALSLIIFFLVFIIIKLLYKDSPISKGRKGEKAVAKELKRLPKKNYTVLNDLLFQHRNYSTQIDHIVVSIYGIFVIETKNYTGVITGNENDEEWIKKNHGNSYNFRNPIVQNTSHIKALKHLLYIKDESVFIPIVVFSKEATLNVRTTSDVVNIQRLNQVIWHHKKRVFSKKQVENIIEKIQESSRPNTIFAKKRHLKLIKKKEKITQKMISQRQCPRCGAKLEKITNKQGSFLHCTNKSCKFRIKL